MILWLTSLSFAKSWCASPLVTHEWGVDVLRMDGKAPEGAALPAWFHRGASSPRRAARVRDLPADSGMRDLPVLQFFGTAAPIGVDVSFTGGKPTAWYPDVERLTADGLGWDALTGKTEGTGSKPGEVPWVSALRKTPGALWISRGEEVDRFVFYEGSHRAEPAIVIERGEQGTAAKPHLVFRNRSNHTVHDVLFVSNGRAITIPAIPAGATAGFLLDKPLVSAEAQAWLRAQWTGEVDPNLGSDCVMMRDPAVGVSAAVDQRIYAPELEVLFDTWGSRFLASSGTHLVYREDVAALAAAMPLMVYTDMHHFVDLHRLGVVLVEGIALP